MLVNRILLLSKSGSLLFQAILCSKKKKRKEKKNKKRKLGSVGLFLIIKFYLKNLYFHDLDTLWKKVSYVYSLSQLIFTTRQEPGLLSLPCIHGALRIFSALKNAVCSGFDDSIPSTQCQIGSLFTSLPSLLQKRCIYSLCHVTQLCLFMW